MKIIAAVEKPKVLAKIVAISAYPGATFTAAQSLYRLLSPAKLKFYS
ncbi:MAG: hypothetical protein ACRERU_09445 [Methylococcales bacterium]